MKRFLTLVSTLSLLLLLAMPVSSARAVEQDLMSCQFGNPLNAEVACDLALKKEVKVNSGTYADANSPAEAVGAEVGDTITWRITVTNNLPTTKPLGDIDVTDVLPSGVSYVSAAGSTGTGSGGIWNFTVGGYEGDDETNDYITTLPATLEIVTTATTTGVFENRADLSAYYCDGPCEYEDGNTANNFDLAYVNITDKAKVLGASTDKSTPQVLAAETLVNAGQPSTIGALSAIALLASTAALWLISRRTSKSSPTTD